MCTDAYSMTSCQRKQVNLEPDKTDYSLVLARKISGCLQITWLIAICEPSLGIYSSVLIRTLDQDVSQRRKCRSTRRRVMASSWWHTPNAARSLFQDLARWCLDIRHFQRQRMGHALLSHLGGAIARKLHDGKRTLWSSQGSRWNHWRRHCRWTWKSSGSHSHYRWRWRHWCHRCRTRWSLWWAVIHGLFRARRHLLKTQCNLLHIFL